MPRLLDMIFFVYFLTHIPISIMVDFQAVLPIAYPASLVKLKEWYCQEYRDPMMVDPPAWFKSFCVCELIFQFPFFFVASYAYLKGAAKCQWIRLPAIVYASHVATTLVGILFHIFFHDFSKSPHPGPRTFEERYTLFSFYMPYLAIPLLILVDALFNPVYQEKPKKQ